MPQRRSALLLLMLALLCFTLCAGAEQEGSITYAEGQAMVAVGKTKQLRLNITPSSLRKAGVVYESSDETIATVSRSGQLKGVSEGECTVTVTSKKDEAAKAVIPVRVVIPVKKLTASLESPSLHVGETAAITCQYAPAQASLKQATFASSNEKVAVVDADGVVTAMGRGQATLTVLSADGAAKTHVTVKVLQQPTGLTLTPESITLSVGKSKAIRASVSPQNADNKKLTWTSSNPNVATVDARGNVKLRASGVAVITASCVEEPSISASVNVECLQLAKSVAFSQKTYTLSVGDSLQVEARVLPESTSNQELAYKVNTPRIATVDENGIITAHRGGKTTLTATTMDGSNRSAKATIEVTSPVTGVHFGQEGARVGAGNYMHITASVEPSDASNKHMTWVSSDPSIATVTGNTHKPRVNGRRWGRCTITGTTEDGGYTASIEINVGSLRRAVQVESIRIRDGKPYIVLKNHSNMDISCVYFDITGTDEQRNPIRLSTLGNTLHGTYTFPLSPDEKTTHGLFTFHDLARYTNLQSVSIAITGWETDTGYYTNSGAMEYEYTIDPDAQEWTTWESEYYKQIQSNPSAN